MALYNFSAGPAMLPSAVMAQAQEEFIDWQGQGHSIMEMSHRSTEFKGVAKEATDSLIRLLNIPTNYRVLFMQGGGRGQFAAVPLNLLGEQQRADYIVSGTWSKSAVQEAEHYCRPYIHSVVTTTDHHSNLIIEAPKTWTTHEDSAYLHFCANETVDGVEFIDVPQANIPIIADLSSTILSRPIQINDYGVIYAGAQKNIGPSGLSIVIIREDLLDQAAKYTPNIMNYSLMAAQESLFNTPPTFAWYLAGLVFSWLEKQGGLSAMDQINDQKAQLLYETIDNSEFYRNLIPSEYRSRMNIPFQLADSSLDVCFLEQAATQELMALKGHRSVGGMRASIYNAMPLAGVQALVDFMREFEKQHA